MKNRMFNRLIQPLKHRINLMIGRAVLTALDDGAGRQYMQMTALKGEEKDGVERVQEYGFTSAPLPGAQVVFVCVGGNRDHPVAIAIDDPRHRKINLKPGEAAMYSWDGSYVLLEEGGKIKAHAPTEIYLDAPSIKSSVPIVVDEE